MTWFLERDGVTLLTCVEDKTQPALPVDPMDRDLPEMLRKHPARYPMKSHALKFKFLATSTVGAQLIAPAGRINAAPTMASPQSVEPQGELPWHNNYFLGNDSTKWAPNCRNYTNIVYRDVWDGIDIEWYEENEKLEFDFVVQPGADASQIRMSCEGLTGEMSLDGFGIQDLGFGEKEKVEVATSLPAHTVAPSDPRNDKSNTGKELLLPTSLGELRTALPQVYQISPGGSRSEVDAKFEIENKNEFGITLPNGYQKEHTLRIDPLIYSTFLGGSGGEFGDAMVKASNNDVIITGGTSSANFPVTPSAHQSVNNGMDDCFISRLSADGTQLIYSTYLGGSGYDDVYAITNDGSGGVIITGMTGSSNFPSSTGFHGGQTDCFVTHIDSSGSQLLYSILVGGNGKEFGSSIANDGSGGCFVGGETSSTNFPVTTGAYDTSFNGSGSYLIGDCFVIHLNGNGTQLLYSTYLGGSNDDQFNGLLCDNTGVVTVVGETFSTDFPTTSDAFDTSFNGGPTDCFVTRLSSDGSHLVYSTFIGGSGHDRGVAIAGDDSGGVFVAGETTSPNFPVTTGTYDTSYNGGDAYIGDGFVSHLNDSGNQLLFSTFLGGSSGDGIYGMAIDEQGDILLLGSARSPNFPTTVGSFNPTFSGVEDCFITRLNRTGNRLLYSTYLGGSNDDWPQSGIVSDGNHGVCVTGQTLSANFPTTSNCVRHLV